MSSRAKPEKDYYSTLGARREWSREEIERRYKRLARLHHPDRGGDEEEMKAINEAYRVLGNEAARSAYDARRAARPRPYRPYAPASSRPAQAGALSGRIVGAGLCLLLGIFLLLLVRAHYIFFLWPLALLAVFIALMGVWMAHGAMVVARVVVTPRHPLRRHVWAQELAFWSCVGFGAYGVYLLLLMI